MEGKQPVGVCRTSTLVANRADQPRDKWKPTNNPYCLKLREAYIKGISFTHLGRKVGLTKATLYQYLYANTNPSPTMWKDICLAIFDEFPELRPQK